jgi:hypothetical protein
MRKIFRGRSMFLGLCLVALCAVAVPASACERCRLTMICTFDECQVVEQCKPVTTFGGLAWEHCDDSYGSCSESGDFCRWASLPARPSLEGVSELSALPALPPWAATPERVR